MSEPKTNQEFMKDFLDFKSQWEQEMGFDEISSKSTNITALHSHQKKKDSKQKPQKPKLKQDKPLSKAVESKEMKLAQLKEDIAPPPGPQTYSLKHDYVEKKAQGYSFGKVQREQPLKLKNNQVEKTDNRFMLYPNIDATRPNYHGNKTVMKKPTPKPDLKKNDAFDPQQSTISEADTRVSSGEREKNVKKGGISIAPLKYSKLTDLELERVIRYELSRFPYLINKRQMIYNPKFTAVEKNIPGVKIVNKKHRSKMVLEKELEERRRPTVYTYSPDDRKIKDKAPLFTFAKTQKERTPSPDRRKALYVTLKLVKKNAPQVAILPEHSVTDNELIKEFEQTRLGPTSYKPSFKLTERRPDFGVVKIQEPINPIEEKEIEDDRPNLDPNYDYDKTNKLVFKYYEPSKDIGPQHTPEKNMYPGKWKFYDYDLDVIREEVGKEIAFARNLTVDQFKEKEEFYYLLVEHNKRQEKRPAVGQYDPRDPRETQIEVDFSKVRGREDFVDPEFLKDQDMEGDVLILDPNKPGRRLPDIKFEKQLGREEDKMETEDINNHEELVIEPNIDVIRRRNVFFADFDKQIGREEKKHVDDDEYYVNNMEYKEMIDPSQKKVIAHDFGKQEERFKVDLRRELGIEQDELVIDNKLPDKQIKGYVMMDKGEDRFPNKVAGKDPFYEELPISDLNIDVDKAIKATKPNVSVVDFNRYPKTKEKEDLDLKIVKQRNEEEKVKHEEKKKETKNNYKVGTIFPQRANVKTKKNQPIAKKKKELDADAEIEQYMKELGLD